VSDADPDRKLIIELDEGVTATLVTEHGVTELTWKEWQDLYGEVFARIGQEVKDNLRPVEFAAWRKLFLLATSRQNGERP
jgi:hypothetical protein